MIKKQLFILTLLFIVLSSCKDSNAEKENNEIIDTVLYKNYINAIKNGSTLQYFTVVIIKDINTGKVREICTKGNFLWGALHIENGLNYSVNGQKKIQELLFKNKKRYFQIKNTAALDNLGIKKYTIEDLKKFEKENNIDSIAKSIKGKWSMYSSDDKNMLLLAHSLFNRGILTGENNCFGGTLIHINQQMLEEKRRKMRN